MILHARKALKNGAVLFTFLSVLLAPFAPVVVSADSQTGDSSANPSLPAYRPGEVLVQLKGDTSPVTLHFAADAPVTDIAKSYAHVGGVAYAEPNYLVHLSAFDPNDPYYADQWYLRQIGMPTAWEQTTGSPDVVVAVLDSGVDINHPDLKDNIWTNSGELAGDGIDNDHNGYIDDIHGWDFIDGSNDPRPSAIPPYSRTALHHGTVVSGVIAAEGNNLQGVAGVSWHTRIMPLRVLDRDGQGDVEQVAEAVDYATKNGARIINLSFVGSGFSQRLYDALRSAYQAGILIVTAAGNVDEQPTGNGDLDQNPMYPVCYDAADNSGQNWILGVTATDLLDQHLPSANYGSHCVDIAAPGASFVSTQVFDPSLGLTEPYGGSWSGTSLATPVVTGVAALLFAQHPDWSNAQVMKRILSTADDISSLNRAYIGKLGTGRVNAARALTGSSTTPPNVDTTAEGGSIVLLPNGFRATKAELVTPKGGALKSWSVVDQNFRAGGGAAVSENKRLAPADTNVRLSAILRGEQDIVFGEGAGGKGFVRVYDVNGQRQSQWLAFDRPFGGGISVASGDVYGDGQGDVVVVPKSNGSGQVRIFDRNGKLRGQFFAYDKRLRGGYSVAVADLDGDGKAEIIVSSLTSELPVRVFRADGSLVTQWKAIGNAGVQVSAGDIDGSGHAAIVLTSLAPGSSNVAIYSSDGELHGVFSALPKGFRSNVTVAVGDVNSDGIDEIVTGPVALGGPQVRIFDNHARLLGQFFAYDQRLRGGLTLSVLR